MDRLMDTLPEDLQQQLDALARVAHALGINDLQFSSYAPAISRLASRQLENSLTLIRLKQLESELKNYLTSLQVEDRLITQWSEKLLSDHLDDGVNSASSLEMRRQALLKKSVEYKKELDAILADTPEEEIPISFTDVLEQQEQNARLHKELKANRAKIKAFQGLPPNKDLALLELKDAKDVLTKLTRVREKLLGNMAKSVR